MKKQKIFLSILSSLLFSGSFNIDVNTPSQIEFSIGDIYFEEFEGYKKIISDSKGVTQQDGAPELPTYSMNYAIDANKEYNVDYIVTEYEIYENINLFPFQPVKNDLNVFVKDKNLYNSNEKYPQDNLSVSRQSMRGHYILGIEFIPYEYDFSSKQLKIFKNVEININEMGYLDNNLTINKKSAVFENIYRNVVANEESMSTDTRSFQEPSILYIIEDYYSIMDNLVQWRRKQGFEVTVIERDDISGSYNTTNVKNYISNAYNNWENPPEYVCFVGDANGTLEVPTYTVGEGGGWGGAYGEGDFPYSLIEGNDNLPDIIVGRMSVRNSSELATVINKIIGYEKNYAGSTDWLNSAALIGDPYDSGISTVITNEYIENVMDIHGGISDIRTKYSGSGFDTFMRSQINDGVGYLNYRGFYGFSNFNSSDVDQLSNGYKLPFLTTLTCDTGSFESDNECITESLFRAGSTTSPKGAVAVVGTAQPYTHTAFNNIVAMGMYEGIFINGAKTAGESLVYGQLALAETYPQNPNNNVYYFATWNNLMGDPATQLWTSRPQDLLVEHTDLYLSGSNNFQVKVTTQFDQPYEGAIVSLYKEISGNVQFQVNGITNENGIVDFEIDDSSIGNVFVTTRCQNCHPVETNFEITSAYPELTLDESSIIINDTNGNNDGNFNPGETVLISFNIDNLSSQQIDNLSLEVVSSTNLMSLQNNSIPSFNIYPQGGIQVENIQIFADYNLLDSADPDLKVFLYSESNNIEWSFDLPLEFKSGDVTFQVDLVNDSNNNGILERGESGNIQLSMINIGSIDLVDISVSMNYGGANLSFETSEFIFPGFNDLIIGQYAVSNYVQVVVSDDVIHGSMISIPINLSGENGFTLSDVFQLQVGTQTVNDPMGPDLHGYYIYDMNDNDYEEFAPSYDWIEIDPDYGGNGDVIDLNGNGSSDLTDNGDNLDDVETIDLPFPFTYYGIEYDKISICSNGWISFGETDMRSFRNYNIPGPGGPSPIVAVFWDDLMTTNNGAIYTYYDQQQNIFIVEWSEMRTFTNNSVETFQLILYDTGWQTPTGDDEMKFQYKEFNNTSIGDYPVGNYDGAVVHGQYCTIGLENHLANDGLEYTFNNTYHQSSMTLSDETALFITTRTLADLPQPSLDYSVEDFYFNLQSDETTNSPITISNSGENGSVLYYSMGISPFASGLDQLDDYGYAWTDSNDDSEYQYDWIDISNDNQIVTLPENDGGGIVDIGFNFPFYENSYSFCAVMANGWVGFSGTNQSWNNGSVFDDDSPDGAIFAFWDDLFPQSLENDEGSGNIRYHSNSERLVLWYDSVRHWTSDERIYDFQVILYKTGEIVVNYREMIGDTDSATIGIVDSNGNYGLETLYNEDGFVQDNMSVKFGQSDDWVEINSNNLSGELQNGESQTYLLDVSTESIENGVYTSYLSINSNSETLSEVSIPIVLNFSVYLGDVNQDGVIDVLDLVKIVAIILDNYAPSDLEMNLSDLNEDGVIDVLDIVIVVNVILNQ